MKNMLILTAIICAVFCSSVGAQSVFVEKGQSGLYGAAGLITGDHSPGGGIELGYIRDGTADIGLAFAYADRGPGSGLLFASIYAVRLTTLSGSGLIITFDPAVGIQRTNVFLQIGGSASAKWQVNPALGVVLTGKGGYTDPYDQQYEGITTTSTHLSVAFGRGKRIYVVSPSYSRREDINSYGITFAISFLGG